MDNKDFSQEEGFFPEDAGFTPEPPQEEEAPVIESLSFTHEPEIHQEDVPSEVPVEAPSAVVLPEAEEAAPSWPEDASGESPAWAQVSFAPPMDAGGEDTWSAPAAPQEDAPLPETDPAGAADIPVEEAVPSFPYADHSETPLDMPFEAVMFGEADAPVEAAPIPEAPAQMEPALADIPTADADTTAEAEALPTSPEPSSPARKRPVRKGRPKRRKGEGLLGIPNILVTLVWLALILAIGVTAGRMMWVCAADVLAFGRENKPVTVTIYEADDLDTITDKLYNAGLIRYKSLFNLYASFSHADEKIKPGIYDLNTLYDYHALVNFMTPRSNREVIKLTIPEGYTCRQIFELLEENRVCTALDAAAYAANGELEDYWFLENVTRGDKYCLEGYLFPDTYEFYKNSTPREALQRMLNNFEAKFDEEMMAQLETLNANVTDGSYTVRDVVTVASLIEKESAAPSESPRIAGVIYNRLYNWGDTPAYLNIDAAIVYAQDGDTTTIDTSLDSPYNTYTHTGLTPTPIANPGLSSLKAALEPESHGYYFYVLNPSTGMHQFASTQEEHNANIAEFYG